MSADSPAPLIDAGTDVRDLDGFMLNVERLMASELVAISSHEVIGAALLLWCRAWKQIPAASLPDDNRVLAAFAKMPILRFQKLREEVLHGFVKCSDGRLYHRVLINEATAAFAKKKTFQKKRATDAKRLREWRAAHGKNDGETQTPTADETGDETADETCFVQSGQGQGQDRDIKESKKEPAAAAADAASGNSPADPAKELFDTAVRVLGTCDVPEKQARALVGKWRAQVKNDGKLLGLIATAGSSHRVEMVPYLMQSVANIVAERGKSSLGPVSL